MFYPHEFLVILLDKLPGINIWDNRPESISGVCILGLKLSIQTLESTSRLIALPAFRLDSLLKCLNPSRLC
jgi:hypothetical protein